MKKLIRYRIPISIVFPATHKRKGEPTYFREKIELALENERGSIIDLWAKLHTIRGNYPLWAKRFEKINRGEAVLELYYWKLPGGRFVIGNEQVTICELGRDSGIGVQKIAFLSSYWINPVLVDKNDMCTGLMVVELAKNDGLSLSDFKEWFKNYDLSEPMAIIYFTPFRY